MSEKTKAINPKDIVGAKKCPLRFVPTALQILAAPACANGAGKYGPYNWRAHPIQYTIYLEAILRHIYAILDGEDVATDSGVSHLSHIAAGLAIIADAQGLGNLIDDRPAKGPAPKLLAAQDTSKKELTVEEQAEWQQYRGEGLGSGAGIGGSGAGIGPVTIYNRGGACGFPDAQADAKRPG